MVAAVSATAGILMMFLINDCKPLGLDPAKYPTQVSQKVFLKELFGLLVALFFDISYTNTLVCAGDLAKMYKLWELIKILQWFKLEETGPKIDYFLKCSWNNMNRKVISTLPKVCTIVIFRSIVQMVSTMSWLAYGSKRRKRRFVLCFTTHRTHTMPHHLPPLLLSIFC